MRKSALIIGAFGLLLLVVIQETGGTLMLGSLLMALKGGMFATKMGLGGLLAMAMAGTKTNDGIATGGTYGRRRAIRSVTSVSETPLELQEPPNGTHLSAEKLAESLNNITLPSTRRMMRQVAILDQLSCLPKVLCGLNTREPNSKTSVINDYGYLIKFLFERDQDDDEQDDEDDEKDVDDEEEDALSRAEALVSKQSKKKSNNKKKGGGSAAAAAEEDADEDDSQSDEEIQVDDKEFDKFADDDDQLDEIARDELLQNEPEMLSYILTEMRQKMKKKNKKGGGYPHHKPYPDHSEVPGYDPGSYNNGGNPDAVNTDSSQAILSERGPYLKGNGFKYRSPNFQVSRVGETEKETSGGFLSSLLPSFSFQSVKPSQNKASSSDKNDPFNTDPFFANFRRSLQFPMEYTQAIKDSTSNSPATVRSLDVQRTNSKFKPVDTTFIDLKREQLLTSSDPILKYRIAAEVGQRTKSSRQCRMLFAKCPYEYSEIMTMINNVKKVVTANAQVGDKEVTLKQNPKGGGTTGKIGGGNPSITSGSGGNVVNLQAPAGMSPGVTSISHELDSGDKVEIMLKFQPKEDKQTRPIFQIIPAPHERVPDKDLINATQSLYEMKKAIQAIQAINRLYNGSNLQPVSAPSPRPTANEPPQQQQQQQEFAAFVAQKVDELNSKGNPRKPKPGSSGLDTKKPAAVAPESIESDSNSKSSEEILSSLATKLKNKNKRKKPPQPQQEEDSQEDEDEDEDEDEEEEEVVLDDPNAALRAQAKFQSLATPPGIPRRPIHTTPNSKNPPTLTLIHLGDKPNAPNLPKFPKESRTHSKKASGILPPRPTRYKIVRPKRKQRAGEDSTDETYAAA